MEKEDKEEEEEDKGKEEEGAMNRIAWRAVSSQQRRHEGWRNELRADEDERSKRRHTAIMSRAVDVRELHKRKAIIQNSEDYEFSLSIGEASRDHAQLKPIG